MSKRPNSSAFFVTTRECSSKDVETFMCMVCRSQWKQWQVAVYQTKNYGNWRPPGGRPMFTQELSVTGATLKDAMKEMRYFCGLPGIEGGLIKSCIRSIWAQRRQPSGKALADREARVR